MAAALLAHHTPDSPRSEKAGELRNAKKDLEAIYLASNGNLALWAAACGALAAHHEMILLRRWDKLRKRRSPRMKAEADKARQAAHAVDAAGDLVRQRYLRTCDKTRGA